MSVPVKPNLLPIKAHFFLFFGGCSPVILFMTTFAKQLGFSAVLVGSIFTVLPLIAMTGKLIMGALADRFRCHKLIIILAILTCVIGFSQLTFLTPLNEKVKAELICNDNSTVRLCQESEGDAGKCIESKIRSEYKEIITINCKMECTVDRQFVESFCEKWNGSHYCKITHNDNLNTSEPLENDSDAKSTKNSTTTLTPVKVTPPLLQFDADLLPHQIKQEGRCLSIQIGGIKDAAFKQDSSFKPYCKTETEFPCQMVCESSVLTESGVVVEEENALSHHQFWLFMLITAIIWVGMSTITCLGETICFGLLGDQSNEFGKQRLWGSLGWGIMSFVGGALVDIISGKKAQKDYRPIFYTSVIILALDLIVASKVKDTKRVKSSSIMWDVGKLFTNFRVIIYVIWCIAMGMSNGIIGNFLFWHLEDLTTCDGLEGIKTLEGLYVSLQGFCGELPFFFLNAWVLNKIGHINSMSLTLFTFGTLFILFSVLKSPVYFLPLAVLNGITFSTMYATMTSYASIIAPPGTEATMQGLIGSLYEGLGVSLGSFIAGLLMHYFKGAKVFSVFGTVALTMCVLHICIQFFLKKSQTTPILTDQGQITSKSVQYTSPENAVSILNAGNNSSEKKINS